MIFLFIFRQKISELSTSDKLATFYHALRLDLSFTAYLATIPLLVFIFCFWYNKKNIKLIRLPIYNQILIVFFSFISVINFNIYREWGSKINEKVFSFVIDTPNEALASSASSPLLLSFFITTGS